MTADFDEHMLNGVLGRWDAAFWILIFTRHFAKAGMRQGRRSEYRQQALNRRAPWIVREGRQDFWSARRCCSCNDLPPSPVAHR